MDSGEYKALWKREEQAAHIHGWDFSHIRGRYEAESDLPWNYREIVREHGGAISASSKDGLTTFRVWLPAHGKESTYEADGKTAE